MSNIPGRFKIDTNQVEFNEVLPNVHNALNQLPESINFTVTSTRRSKGNTSNLSETHIHGNAIDIKDDEDGDYFWNWLDTNEGLKWKNDNNATIIYHSNYGGKGYHYHLQFNNKK